MKLDDEWNMDELLKSCLQSKPVVDVTLHQKVVQAWKERSVMKKKNKIAVAAVVFGVILSTATVGAAGRYLSSKDIAKEMGYDEMGTIFEKDNAMTINETQTNGIYEFTLLGITEGENIYEIDGAGKDIKRNAFYAVVAISKTDGSSLSLEEYYKKDWFISPLIQGLEPWKYNIASMDGGYSELELDGVVYRMIDCKEISCFADRKMYLCISDTVFFDKDAFCYDEASGIISTNSKYDGINILFDLPIDEKMADQKKAEEWLRAYDEAGNSVETDESGPNETGETLGLEIENPEAAADCEAFIAAQKVGVENVNSVLKNMGMDVLQSKTVKESDGEFHFSCATEEGSEWSATYSLDSMKLGPEYSYQYGESEDAAELMIQIVILNQDGTATCTVYQKNYRN